MGLSDALKSFPIGLAVLIQYRSVTASQPPSHVAIAITLNAKASSLKIKNDSTQHKNDSIQAYSAAHAVTHESYVAISRLGSESKTYERADSSRKRCAIC